MSPSIHTRLCAALLTCLSAVLHGQVAPPLTIERAYSLPSLIGTAPRGAAWSPDSRRLAFLWNDEGTAFCDVWLVDTPNGRPVRVTRLPRPVVPPGPDSSYARQRALIAAERDAGVSSVQFTADGGRMLFTFRGDVFRVAPGSAPVQLTKTPEPEQSVTLIPRSNRVSWLSRGDVWEGTLDGDSLRGRVQRTRFASAGVGVERFSWSSDGAMLAVVEVDRRAIPQRGIPDYLTAETQMPLARRNYPGEVSESRRIGVVTVDGADVRWLQLGADPQELIFTVAWAPAASRLLVDMSDLFVKDRRIMTVDARTGVAATIVREEQPLNVSAEWWADWSPDGRQVYFTSDRETDYHVYAVSATGGTPRALTRGNWAVFGVDVTPRGLLIVGNRGRSEDRQMFRVGLNGGEPQRISVRDGTHSPTVSPDGRQVADLFSADTIPPDLFLTDVDAPAGQAERERRVTTSPSAEFATYRWVMPRYVSFPSRADGAILNGRLLMPQGHVAGSRVPVIVGSAYSNTVRNQWGGRNAHPLWGLDAVLLQQGYAVFEVDVAGSSGHGTTFRRRIRLDYGGIDVEDLQSGVEYLVREGIADSSRIGIWGSSYGGLLTTMSLFTKPGVYRAGIAGAPATNVWHALTGEQRVMMRPQEQMAAYAKASSHTKAAGLRDHLMIVHGMRDQVVLYKDSVWLTQYLMQLGRSVELLTLPDAQHGWDTEGLYQTRFAFTRMLEFFEKHLGVAPK